MELGFLPLFILTGQVMDVLSPYGANGLSDLQSSLWPKGTGCYMERKDVTRTGLVPEPIKSPL